MLIYWHQKQEETTQIILVVNVFVCKREDECVQRKQWAGLQSVTTGLKTRPTQALHLQLQAFTVCDQAL